MTGISVSSVGVSRRAGILVGGGLPRIGGEALGRAACIVAGTERPGGAGMLRVCWAVAAVGTRPRDGVRQSPPDVPVLPQPLLEHLLE